MKDSLADWLSNRSALSEPTSVKPIRSAHSGRDGHAAFLFQQVRPRDLARFERLTLALALARSDARAGRRLSFSRLASWQRLLLGAQSVPFRVTDAFAKHGRERYGLNSFSQQGFAACLRDANDVLVSRSLRAARAYLDVLFFHPFADGNARAATLTLDFILAREGIVLAQVAPLFVVSRRADDLPGAQALVRLVEMLAAPAARPQTPASRSGLTCSRRL